MASIGYLHLPGSVDDRAVCKLGFDFLLAKLAPVVGEASLAVTRSGATATRVNPQGLIEVVPADTPRFTYDLVTKKPKGLLIERASTNLIAYTDYMAGQAAGFYSFTNTTLSDSGIPSPVAGQNWTKFEATTSAISNAPKTITGAGSASGVVYSVYVKKGSGATDANGYFLHNSTTGQTIMGGRLNFDTGVWTTSSGSGTATVEQIGEGEYRLTLASTNNVAAGNNIAFYTAFTGSPETAGEYSYATAPQLEQGLKATSLILTAGAQVTRNADIPRCSDISGFYNEAEGTLVAEFIAGPAPGAGVFNRVVSLNNGSGNEEVYIGQSNADNGARFFVIDGGTVQGTHQAGTLVEGEVARIVGAYKVDACAASLNGGSVVQDTGAPTMPSPTILDFGQAVGLGFAQCHLRRFYYFPKRLENATVQAIALSGPTILFTSVPRRRLNVAAAFPSIPNDLPIGLRRFLEKVKELLEVRNAQVGSPLDANPTYRDLIDAGLIKVTEDAPLLAAGREFRLDTKTWVSSNIPEWITDTTNPPAPTGFTVTANTSVITLKWDAPTFPNYKQTLVYRATSNNLSEAEIVGSNTGNTYVDDLPPEGTQYFYWIRHESRSELRSDFNSVNGTSATNTPAAPGVSYAFSGENLVLSWTTPVSNLAIQYYEISWGAVPGANPVGISQSNTLRVRADFGGTRKYWVRAVDIRFGFGTAASVDVEVESPGQPTLTQSVVNGSLVLNVSLTPGSLPIAYYDLRYGEDWEGGSQFGISLATRYEFSINWTGSRSFHIVAVDTAGNQSEVGSATFTANTPTVTSVVAQTLDNNVLLRWTASPGTLPIQTFNVYRNGVLVGSDPAQFAVVFESAGGSYLYEVEAVDTAGNMSAKTGTRATVSQPPDYVLFDNRQADLLTPLGYHLSLPGSSGNFATTPDSAALDITGDIDIRVKAAAIDWTPTGFQHFIARRPGGNQDSWLFRLQTGSTGKLNFEWNTTGNSSTGWVFATSTAAPTVADGEALWVRVTLDVDNGNGGRDIKFYTSNDYNPDTGAGTWTQLGSTVTQAGTTSIFAGNGGLSIGSPFAGTSELFAGKVYYAEVRNGINGDVVACFDARDARLTEKNFVSSKTGELWTVNGSTAKITADNLTVHYDRDTGRLLANVDASETWESHFTSREWESPQDQIDAGYTNYLVGKTTGSFEERVDYGTTIGATKITMTPTEVSEQGSVTVTPTLKVSADDSTYTDFEGVYEAYSTVFRYVKYLLEFAADAGAEGLADDSPSLLAINPITQKLDVKLKTAQGTVTCSSSDTDGTVVDISSWGFIDVQAINVTPLSTSAKHPTYDFVDAPNPTEFKVFLWDAAGNRVSGDASWMIRGV